MPLISVISPVYNGERTLTETIESVLRQSFEDFELIIINDGSTDKTLAIALGIKDARIKVYTYPNGGLAKSRNRGFDKSKGEFVTFIDADDLWTQDKIKKQLEAFQDHPEASVVYSWVDCINSKGHFLSTGARFTQQQGEIYIESLQHSVWQNGSNAMIRSAVFKEVGGFDESLATGEDWDLSIKLAKNYYCVCVPEVHVFYRVSPNTLSTNVSWTEADWLRIADRAFKAAPPELQYLKRTCLANLYWFLISKTLDKPSNQTRSTELARFLYLLLKNKPSLIKQKKFMLKVILKILIGFGRFSKKSVMIGP